MRMTQGPIFINMHAVNSISAFVQGGEAQLEMMCEFVISGLIIICQSMKIKRYT